MGGAHTRHGRAVSISHLGSSCRCMLRIERNDTIPQSVGLAIKAIHENNGYTHAILGCPSAAPSQPTAAPLSSHPIPSPTLLPCGSGAPLARATAGHCGGRDNGAAVTDAAMCREMAAAIGLTVDKVADQRRYAQGCIVNEMTNGVWLNVGPRATSGNKLWIIDASHPTNGVTGRVRRNVDWYIPTIPTAAVIPGPNVTLTTAPMSAGRLIHTATQPPMTEYRELPLRDDHTTPVNLSRNERDTARQPVPEGSTIPSVAKPSFNACTVGDQCCGCFRYCQLTVEGIYGGGLCYPLHGTCVRTDSGESCGASWASISPTISSSTDHLAPRCTTFDWCCGCIEGCVAQSTGQYGGGSCSVVDGIANALRAEARANRNSSRIG
eukprot:gene57903-biopygen108846